jgi:hypothetical protein
MFGTFGESNGNYFNRRLWEVSNNIRFVLYEIQVEMPGFVGHSLLVHQMGNQTIGFNLMLSFRTSTSDGLLFYTGKNVFRAK